MKKYLPIILSFIIFCFISTAAVAQVGTNPGSTGGVNTINVTFTNPFRHGNDLYNILQAIVNNIILPIGGVLCVLAFIYTGFKYVIARGEPGKIKDAHQALLFTAVGTALLLGAWTIANVVRTTITSLVP